MNYKDLYDNQKQIVERLHNEGSIDIEEIPWNVVQPIWYSGWVDRVETDGGHLVYRLSHEGREAYEAAQPIVAVKSDKPMRLIDPLPRVQIGDDIYEPIGPPTPATLQTALDLANSLLNEEIERNRQSNDVIARLRDDKEKLREALKPFAMLYDQWYDRKIIDVSFREWFLKQFAEKIDAGTFRDHLELACQLVNNEDK